ncbi:hypothetical protein CERZMDRAFT_91311 [Cercospora zeae-maydis SCOH1-5]|uniref:Uncharacterized protein n=1 Tax=Cercospora zeae-maydis SCOH1-5 TaxID=717836 RepID=A0A6A6F734_9PEZI|nr:hypothetical protein CERZMDRAFT_91311 [Cercospora zeae-maydis SCOH1-5]
MKNECATVDSIMKAVYLTGCLRTVIHCPHAAWILFSQAPFQMPLVRAEWSYQPEQYDHPSVVVRIELRIATDTYPLLDTLTYVKPAAYHRSSFRIPRSRARARVAAVFDSSCLLACSFC